MRIPGEGVRIPEWGVRILEWGLRILVALFYYDSIMVRASQAQNPLIPIMSTETTPIEGPQELIVRSQEAMQLFRSFSFELESKNNDELPQSELTLAVVEERKRNDEREKSLSELRKHFEPCAISKY